MTSEVGLSSVAIIGTGLIGTSIGLALRARGVTVWLSDTDPAAVAGAAEVGAGVIGVPPAPCDLVVLAVPPALVAQVYRESKRATLGYAFTDVASTKSNVVLEVSSFPGSSDFIGGHPMGGRERSGPHAARPDLFEGRPWALTPTPETSSHVLTAARALARACGAVPVELAAAEHDAAVAVVSHAPHVLSSLAAARLAQAGEPVLAMAGPGVRDVTRLAAADPRLWIDILTSNAAAVGDVLRAVREDLNGVLAALDRLAGRGGPARPASAPGDEDGPDEDGPDEPTAALADLLRRGNQGRARIPGKHGTAPTAYAFVPVVVTDRPRELARLLGDAAAAGVNVEDVRIDHALGQPRGLVELAVLPTAVRTLTEALRRRGWNVREADETER